MTSSEESPPVGKKNYDDISFEVKNRLYSGAKGW